MQQIERDTDSFATARREFLARCGRLAVVTPPTVTLMLAASRHHFAVAQSGTEQRARGPNQGFRPNNGFGNGGGDGVPGRSRHEDRDR